MDGRSGRRIRKGKRIGIQIFLNFFAASAASAFIHIILEDRLIGVAEESPLVFRSLAVKHEFLDGPSSFIKSDPFTILQKVRIFVRKL
jgi:hypothetical protein